MSCHPRLVRAVLVATLLVITLLPAAAREESSQEYSLVELGASGQQPKPIRQGPPVYPTALKKAGQPGEAVIEFFVDAKGDVQLPRIVSSTATEFGYAAVQAVATWRFEPPKRNRKRTVVRVRGPVEFCKERAEAEPAP